MKNQLTRLQIKTPPDTGTETAVTISGDVRSPGRLHHRVEWDVPSSQRRYRLRQEADCTEQRRPKRSEELTVATAGRVTSTGGV